MAQARTWGKGWTLQAKRDYLQKQIAETARVAGSYAEIGSVAVVENELAAMRRAIEELIELAQ